MERRSKEVNNSSWHEITAQLMIIECICHYVTACIATGLYWLSTGQFNRTFMCKKKNKNQMKTDDSDSFRQCQSAWYWINELTFAGLVCACDWLTNKRGRGRLLLPGAMPVNLWRRRILIALCRPKVIWLMFSLHFECWLDHTDILWPLIMDNI